MHTTGTLGCDLLDFSDYCGSSVINHWHFITGSHILTLRVNGTSNRISFRDYSIELHYIGHAIDLRV